MDLSIILDPFYLALCVVYLFRFLCALFLTAVMMKSGYCADMQSSQEVFIERLQSAKQTRWDQRGDTRGFQTLYTLHIAKLHPHVTKVVTHWS